jgi:hypothetical protein
MILYLLLAVVGVSLSVVVTLLRQTRNSKRMDQTADRLARRLALTVVMKELASTPESKPTEPEPDDPAIPVDFGPRSRPSTLAKRDSA